MVDLLKVMKEKKKLSKKNSISRKAVLQKSEEEIKKSQIKNNNQIVRKTVTKRVPC